MKYANINTISLIAGLILGSLLMWSSESSNSSTSESGNFSHVTQKYDSRLVLFTNSTCPYCKDAKTYLSKKNISFYEVVVDQNADGAAYFDTLEEKWVPVIYSKSIKISGFNRELYAELSSFEN